MSAGTPRQEVNTRCCSLGKTYGRKLGGRENVTTECNKLARKLSQKSKNKVICHMALGRCCINEARKHTRRQVFSVSVLGPSYNDLGYSEHPVLQRLD